MVVSTRRQVLVGAAAAAAMTAPAALRGQPARKRPKSDGQASALIAQIFASKPAPAVSAAVADVSGLRWAEALGSVNLELGTSATADHVFPLGSVSKVLTATVAAKLASRGTLDLASPISRWLPGLPAQHRDTTLLQLLTHRGGIRHFNKAEVDMGTPGGAVYMRFYPTDADVLRLFINDPLVAPPGSSVSYSSYGYTLASIVMALAADRPFLDLINQEIGQTFGLKSLAADDPWTLIPNRSGQYMNDLDAKMLCPGVAEAVQAKSTNGWARVPFSNPAYCWAGAGFLMSPSDAARFGAAIASPSRRLVTEKERALLFTPVTPATKGLPPLGLGWRIDTDQKGRRRWHHAGATPGGCYMLAVYPDQKLAVALAGNVMTMKMNVSQAAADLAEAFAT